MANSKKEHNDKVLKLEKKIKKLHKQAKDSTLRKMGSEDAAQLREHYEQQIANLYTTLSEEKEASCDSNEKKLKEILNENQRIQREMAEVREDNDFKNQILRALTEKYKDIEDACNMKETANENYGELFTSMDNASRYIKKLQEELHSLQASSEMTESMNCILQACLSENKTELERQASLLEEKANEVQYHLELNQIYQQELAAQRVDFERAMSELQSELEEQRSIYEKAALSERKVKALEASKAEAEKKLMIYTENFNNTLKREEALKQSIESTKDMYSKVTEKQKNDLVNYYTGLMKVLEDSKNSLEEKAKYYESQLSIMKQKESKFEAERQKLVNDSKELMKKEKELKQVLEKQVNSNTHLMKQIESLEMEKNKMQTLHREHEKLKLELQELKDTLSTEKSSSSEYARGYEKKLEEAKSEVFKLDKQVKELKRKQVELASERQAERMQLEARSQELNGEIISMQGALNKLAQEKNALLQKAALYDSLTREDESKTLQAVREIEEKNLKIIDLEVQLSRYKNMVMQLETTNSSLKGKSSNMDELQFNIIAIKEQLLRTKNECRPKFKSFELEFLKCRNSIKMLIERSQMRYRDVIVKLQSEDYMTQKYQNDAYALHEKLRSYGDEFKAFYSDFSADPVLFPFHVVDKMIVYISSLKKDQREEIKPVSVARPGIIKPTPVSRPVTEMASRPEPAQKQKGGNGLKGWLSSFFLTEKEMDSLSGTQNI
eukprot:TRINITY_DN7071_c0_g1_i4.p1 TRINITY_DN7071_c0_g1~~TRINITY_DN7071_c0_g1_i4.p1  ORF type:complete len:727 (-),score=242.34 TRINITY_DN7071_c0_g1_i4:124-2304(-)